MQTCPGHNTAQKPTRLPSAALASQALGRLHHTPSTSSNDLGLLEGAVHSQAGIPSAPPGLFSSDFLLLGSLFLLLVGKVPIIF